MFIVFSLVIKEIRTNLLWLVVHIGGINVPTLRKTKHLTLKIIDFFLSFINVRNYGISGNTYKSDHRIRVRQIVVIYGCTNVFVLFDYLPF